MRDVDPSASHHRLGPLEHLALGFGVLVAIGLLTWLLWNCRAGIDFSDEGFYLNWITHPELYPVSHTQFGFVYHPIYELVGRNLVILRQLNVLLTFGTAWFLFACVLLVDLKLPRIEIVCKLSLAFILATSSFAFLYFWLPTPNYNSLALQGLILGSSAVLLIRSDSQRMRAGGGGLLGLALWLTFMAKPTTAALAGPLWLILLISYGRFDFLSIGVAGVVGLVFALLSCLAIDSSVSGFADRLLGAGADLEKMRARYTFGEILRLDSFQLGKSESRVFWSGSAFVFLGSLLAGSGKPNVRLAATVATVMALIAFVAAISICYWQCPTLGGLLGLGPADLTGYVPSSDWVNMFPFRGLLLLTPPAGALLLFLVGCRFCEWRSRGREFAQAICLTVLPYAYAFGSNGNYWSKMGGAALFWCAAGITLLRPHFRPDHLVVRILPFALSMLAGIIWLLIPATEIPYRHSASLRASTATLVTADGSRIRVSAEAARYTREIQDLASRHGFQAGDPWIDLSGHYPTVAYLIGARHLGMAWLPGGGSNSEAFVQASLDRVPAEDLSRAWVLCEPDGPRKLSPQLLRRYGLDLERDYVEVGRITSPAAEYSKVFTQRLYKRKSARPGGN